MTEGYGCLAGESKSACGERPGERIRCHRQQQRGQQWTGESESLHGRFPCGWLPHYFTRCTVGAFHAPVSTSGFGKYMRMTGRNGPFGAGSQFASLSAPGLPLCM